MSVAFVEGGVSEMWVYRDELENYDLAGWCECVK